MLLLKSINPGFPYSFCWQGYTVQSSNLYNARVTPTHGRTSYERKVGLRTYGSSSGSGVPGNCFSL